MKKTVKEWLQELPEPYRTKALKYAALEGSENLTLPSMTEALRYAFRWSQTVQGTEYWVELKRRYEYTHEIVFEDTLSAAKERQQKEHGNKSIYQGIYKYSKGKGNNFYSFFVYK